MAKNGYRIYLGKCLLPIAPESIETSINGQNDTTTLISGGEVNILKTPGLTDVSFECDLPNVQYPFATYKGGFQRAKYFLDYFENLMTSKKPFQFIVTRSMPRGRTLFNTNLKVAMENYTITDDAENGFDIKVKVELKQYRSYGTKTVKIEQQQEQPTATTEEQRPAETSPAPAATTTYTVKSGDCLWKIAKQFYGNGATWNTIYAANQGVVGSNPNLIYPGQVLTIPAAS